MHYIYNVKIKIENHNAAYFNDNEDIEHANKFYQYKK